jgi:hypothetical protein
MKSNSEEDEEAKEAAVPMHCDEPSLWYIVMSQDRSDIFSQNLFGDDTENVPPPLPPMQPPSDEEEVMILIIRMIDAYIYAGQLNSFTHVRSLLCSLVPIDKEGIIITIIINMHMLVN